jgi:hypothetical protein
MEAQQGRTDDPENDGQLDADSAGDACTRFARGPLPQSLYVLEQGHENKNNAHKWERKADRHHGAPFTV